MEKQAETNLHEEIQCSEHKEDRKLIKRIFGIISYLVVCVLLLLTVAILFMIFKGKGQDSLPVVLNHQVYIIRSNSMSPALKAGSIAVVKLVDCGDIKENDIITYRREGNTTAVTHRVVEVVRDEELRFITKGDANNTNDFFAVKSDEVIGRVTMGIPLVGYFMAFSGTRYGALVLLIIPGILILLYQTYQLIRHSKKNSV